MFSALSFGKKTVDSVMAAFHQAVSDLEEVARHHGEEAEQHAQSAAEALSNERYARSEVRRANETAEKLRSLLGS